MKRRTVRAKQREEKRKARKKAAQAKPSGKSSYARKRAYLLSHGLWGWEVAEKFWRQT